MAESPWFVTPSAVRRYMEIRRTPFRRPGRPDKPGDDLTFEQAQTELLEYCARTWTERYQGTDRSPSITRHGAYCYRGVGPLRLSLIVSMERRQEGAKPQLVDVARGHG